jgi:pimeloyl-ACP methyl ester carboxylesterase
MTGAIFRRSGTAYPRGVKGSCMLRQFSSDGVHIAYIDVPPVAHDRGEPILLIHGFASNHRINWVNPRWVETLTRSGRRVIALDNRGHGASQKLYSMPIRLTHTPARASGW